MYFFKCLGTLPRYSKVVPYPTLDLYLSLLLKDYKWILFFKLAKTFEMHCRFNHILYALGCPSLL